MLTNLSTTDVIILGAAIYLGIGKLGSLWYQIRKGENDGMDRREQDNKEQAKINREWTAIHHARKDINEEKKTLNEERANLNEWQKQIMETALAATEKQKTDS